MNFELDDELLVLKKNVREFIQTEVEAVAMQMEEDNAIPSRIINLSKEMGLFGLSIPEEYRGLGIKTKHGHFIGASLTNKTIRQILS